MFKVPKPLYDYFSVLPLEDQYYHEAERVYFDSDNQTKRIKFIIIDHVVYHAINLDVHGHWRQYSQTVINALKVCQEKEFSSATTENVSPYPTYEMLKTHLIASGFPYDEYFSLEYINKRKVLDLLADFAYCIRCKIEKIKLWHFSNEAIIRDHSKGQGWFHVDPSSDDEEMDKKKESTKKTDVLVENSNTESEVTKPNTVDIGTKISSVYTLNFQGELSIHKEYYERIHNFISMMYNDPSNVNKITEKNFKKLTTWYLKFTISTTLVMKIFLWQKNYKCVAIFTFF